VSKFGYKFGQLSNLQTFKKENCNPQAKHVRLSEPKKRSSAEICSHEQNSAPGSKKEKSAPVNESKTSSHIICLEQVGELAPNIFFGLPSLVKEHC
jgi:hypothetical protein